MAKKEGCGMVLTRGASHRKNTTSELKNTRCHELWTSFLIPNGTEGLISSLAPSEDDPI